MQIYAVLHHTCFDMNISCTTIDLGLCFVYQLCKLLGLCFVLCMNSGSPHFLSGSLYKTLLSQGTHLHWFQQSWYFSFCCLHALCSPHRLYSDPQHLPALSLHVICVPFTFCAMSLLENLAALPNSLLPELLINQVSLVALLKSCWGRFGGVQLLDIALGWKWRAKGATLALDIICALLKFNRSCSLKVAVSDSLFQATLVAAPATVYTTPGMSVREYGPWCKVEHWIYHWGQCRQRGTSSLCITDRDSQWLPPTWQQSEQTQAPPQSLWNSPNHVCW